MNKPLLLIHLGLTDLNRPVSPARVELYADDMAGDRWHDSPDPVVVTEDGLIVNGQHRLLAATRVEWEECDDVPSFVVVLGADPKTALLMDEATRTTKDRRTIALAFARVAA